MSEASWGLSWKMLAPRSRFLERVWTCWRQDGEQEGQDGDQEGQHGDQERLDESTRARMGRAIHAGVLQVIGNVVKLLLAEGVGVPNTCIKKTKQSSR